MCYKMQTCSLIVYSPTSDQTVAVLALSASIMGASQQDFFFSNRVSLVNQVSSKFDSLLNKVLNKLLKITVLLFY